MTQTMKEKIAEAMRSVDPDDRVWASIDDFEEADGRSDHVIDLYADAVLDVIRGMPALEFRFPFGRTSGEMVAPTSFDAVYSIRERGPVFECVFRGSHLVFAVGRFRDLDDAKEAAQSDYTRRILSAIDLSAPKQKGQSDD